MNIKVHELVGLNEASETLKLTTKDLLTKVLEDEIKLYTIVKQDRKIEFTLYSTEEPDLEYGFDKMPIFSEGFIYSENLNLNIGQILKITKKATMSLFVNGNFSEKDFFYELFLNECISKLKDTKWVTEDLDDTQISIEDVFLHSSVLSQFGSQNDNTDKSSVKNIKEPASKTALKVIGLLLHHLAKNPKYATGDNPNKSQIKELLVNLADELDINSYGLSKVDERLLSDALKYIENQKN